MTLGPKTLYELKCFYRLKTSSPTVWTCTIKNTQYLVITWVTWKHAYSDGFHENDFRMKFVGIPEAIVWLFCHLLSFLNSYNNKQNWALFNQEMASEKLWR